MSVNNNSPRFSGNEMRSIASLIPRFLDNPDMEKVGVTSKLFFETTELRKQVMQALQPEQVDSTVEQIMALDLPEDKIVELLKLLKPMSKEEITGFLYRVRTLKVPKSIRARVIWELAKYPTTDRIAFLDHLLSLEFPIESQARVRGISLAINRLREFYKPYNKDLVKPILALKLKPSQINALVRSLQNFSSEERTQFMQQILSLNLAPALKSASFIKTLMRIPTYEQAAFISQISALNLKPATDELEVFTHFSNTSRVNFIQEATSNYSTESEISEALINFNPRGEDQDGFSPFCIYLSLVSQDPLKVLLRFMKKVIYEKAMPRIAYQDSPGLDYGGVTRDFMTRLFDALCGPKGLPMHTETPTGDGPLPMLFADTEQLSERKQTLCYEGVGFLLGLALLGHLNIKIGGHFSPSLYAMLHALSTEEMRQLGSTTDITTLLPIHEKLKKAYLKTNCAGYFGKPDNLDSDIDQLSEGQPNEFLQRFFEIETMEELLDKENIHSILYATCLIAKGIWKYFQQDWDTIKGQTPEDLMIKIEGDPSKELVYTAILSNVDSPAKYYLLRWVMEVDKTQLEKLVFAITASKKLSGKPEELVINALEMPTNGAIPYPKYHTCITTIDLHNYPTFELFKKQLEESLKSVDETAFTTL